MQKREHNLIAEDTPWKKKIFRIIYFSDTPSGKIFDDYLEYFHCYDGKCSKSR